MHHTCHCQLQKASLCQDDISLDLHEEVLYLLQHLMLHPLLISVRDKIIWMVKKTEQKGESFELTY